MIVVGGPSGAGKSHVAAALAASLGVAFCEGDALHPVANIAKIARGEPLDDADRTPWLDRVAQWIEAHRGQGGVVACSALRRVYRDRLRRADPALRFVILAPPVDVIAARLDHRTGHFMPATLLASQLATLEPLRADEDALSIDADIDVAATVARIEAWLA